MNSLLDTHKHIWTANQWINHLKREHIKFSKALRYYSTAQLLQDGDLILAEKAICVVFSEKCAHHIENIFTGFCN